MLSRRDLKFEKLIYESYLMPVAKINYKYAANGKEVVAYKLLEIPALYQYAEVVHQIVDVPNDLFLTQDKFEDTDEAIVIKRYVIKRVIQIVKSNRLRSDKLSFYWSKTDSAGNEVTGGLFPELGYDIFSLSRDKKKKITRIIRGTLDRLMELNVISGYDEYRKDNSNKKNDPIMGFVVHHKK